MDRKRKTHLRRGAISSQIYSVNTLNSNKLRQGYLVWDKTTGQWLYRDLSGSVQALGAGGGGDVVGPGTSTNNTVALWDGVTGKLLKDGGPLYTSIVLGPATATDNTVPIYDGVTGKLLKDGGPVAANIVLGPATAIDGHIALFDGITGKLIKDGGVLASATGLEALDEGNGIGWRLKGKDPANYGNIGLHAIDFINSTAPSTTVGVTDYDSFGAGRDNIVSSHFSAVFGYNNECTGDYCLVMGSNNDCEGDNTAMLGSWNDALLAGDYCLIFGKNNKVSAIGSFGGGFQNGAGYNDLRGDYSISIQHNTIQKYLYADYGVILGGSNNSNQSTAVNSVILGGVGVNATQPDMVYISGTKYKSYTSIEIAALADSELGSFVFDSDLQALVQCTDATVAANVWSSVRPTGLERVTDVNTGFRLVGRDPTHYADIGIEAVDLSYSGALSTTYGARGDYSFACGYTPTVLGDYSFATGYRNSVNGNYAFSAGHTCNVAGNYSAAFGQYTIASGQYSFAFGDSSSATGNNSFAGGDNGSAKGTNSFCFQDATVISTYFNSGISSAILGGQNNLINSGGNYAAILGGVTNVINTTADYSVILGGQSQTATQPDMVYMPGLKLKELATAPATPEPGTMYLDTSDANNHVLKVYLNVAGVGTWTTVTVS